MLDWRAVGLWRPLAAILAGVLVPAALAFGLLQLAGAPVAVDSDDWLRRHLLLILYGLASAPLLAWLTLPLTWPLVFALAVRGWAGALGAVLAANAVGLPVLHLLLHADVTTEDTGVLPDMILALSCQGLVGWAALWALLNARRVH